jgi:hypothetical protein
MINIDECSIQYNYVLKDSYESGPMNVQKWKRISKQDNVWSFQIKQITGNQISGVPPITLHFQGAGYGQGGDDYGYGKYIWEENDIGEDDFYLSNKDSENLLLPLFEN